LAELGYEFQVAAYAFVIAGLVATIARHRSPVALFAVATYFHFLVGIFWFHAALLWRVIEDRGAVKSPNHHSGVLLAGRIAADHDYSVEAVGHCGMQPQHSDSGSASGSLLIA
jgi:hypothetical protein